MQAQRLNDIDRRPALPEPSNDTPSAPVKRDGDVTMRGTRSSLTGKRVLVVEDEAILAIQVEDDLEQAGCKVVGPACSVRRALQLIESEPLEVAVLDYRLGDDTSREIAVTLRMRHIPFLFMTSTVSTDLPRELRDVPRLQKPVKCESLIAALNAILQFR